MERYAATKAPFGAWLLRQGTRADWVGDFAKTAAHDPKFPKNGDPEAVRARMRELQADGDAWAAIDDAEDDWLCI